MFDRDAALRNADKAMKLGKLDQAIAEYASIVERHPQDLSTANMLGDLYARAGQVDSAVAEYVRIGERYLDDGFLPKASAVFKKVLKLRPDDEPSLLHLGQIAARQGLLADARGFMNAVMTRRRGRGDAAGADDVLIEMASIDPGDAEARMVAARILAGRGDADAASSALRELALDLLEKERPQEAIDVLREAVHLVPGDRHARRQLVTLLHDLDQGAEAEVYLTREVAGDDPVMLLIVARAELETGQLEEGREDLRRAVAHEHVRADALAFMRGLAPRQADVAFIVADALADAAIASGEPARAVEVLSEFALVAPEHVRAALRLVEICLEEGLDHLVAGAQGSLADAYAAAGQVDAARVIAEDLVAAAPDDDLARMRLVRIYGAVGIEQPEAAVETFLRPPTPVAAPAPQVAPAPTPASAQPAEPAEPPEPAKPAPPSRSSEVDLTASLDTLDAPAAEPAPQPLEAVFDGFRERNRVEETERAESAYEEAQMAAALNQPADAERLYIEAARSPHFRFRAAGALARMLRDQGRLPDAIEWFERASEVPAPDQDAGFALLYDLGDTLERVGEGMRAMAIFMELHADAGDYRGIAARIDRLTRAEIGG